MIAKLRLAHPGVLEQNTSRTIYADKDTSLEETPQGVIVQSGGTRVLVPWPSVASITYEQPSPEQPTAEPANADPRPERAAKRARASARPTPSR